MQLSIQPLEASNVEALGDLIFEFYQEDPGHVAMSRERAHRTAHALLRGSVHALPQMLYAGLDVVGYAILIPYFSVEMSGEIVTLDELFLRPAWRGHGLGSQYLTQLQVWARARGVRKLQLEVDHHNLGAQRLYQRFGFIDDHRHMYCWYRPELDVERFDELQREL